MVYLNKVESGEKMTESEANNEYIKQMYEQILTFSKMEELDDFLENQLNGDSEDIKKIKNLLEQELERTLKEENEDEEFKEAYIKELIEKIKELEEFIPLTSVDKKSEDESEIKASRPLRIVWAKKPDGESYCFEELRDCENEIERENYHYFWDLLKKFIDNRDYELTGADQLTNHEKIRDIYKIKPKSRGRQDRFYGYKIGDVVFIIGVYNKKAGTNSKWQSWLIKRKKEVKEQYEELKEKLKDPVERDRILREEEAEFKKIEELIKPREKIEAQTITTEEGIEYLRQYFNEYKDLEVPKEYCVRDKKTGKTIELGKWLYRKVKKFTDIEIKQILEITSNISWIDPLKIEKLKKMTMEEIIEKSQRKEGEKEVKPEEAEERFKTGENGQIIYEIDLNGQHLDKTGWDFLVIAAIHEFYKREHTYDIPENLIVLIKPNEKYEIGRYIHKFIIAGKLPYRKKELLTKATDSGFEAFIKRKHAELLEKGKEELVQDTKEKQTSEIPSIEIVETNPEPTLPEEEIEVLTIEPEKEAKPKKSPAQEKREQKYRDEWLKTFEIVERVYNHLGHTILRIGFIYDGKDLGKWIADQRKKRKEGKLPQEFVDKLNSVEIVWEAKSKRGKEEEARILEKLGIESVKIVDGQMVNYYKDGTIKTTGNMDNLVELPTNPEPEPQPEPELEPIELPTNPEPEVKTEERPTELPVNPIPEEEIRKNVELEETPQISESIEEPIATERQIEIPEKGTTENVELTEDLIGQLANQVETETRENERKEALIGEAELLLVRLMEVREEAARLDEELRKLNEQIQKEIGEEYGQR